MKRSSSNVGSEKPAKRKKLSPPQENPTPAPPALVPAVRYEFPKKHKQVVSYKTPESVFPPVLYTNVEYTKGPCLFKQSIDENAIAHAKLPPDYFKACFNQADFPYAPVLPQPLLWGHKYAATEAVKHGYPINVLRKLGTITRTVTAKAAPPSRGKTHCKDPTQHDVDTTIRRYKLNKAQTKKQIVLEHPNLSPQELDDKLQALQRESSRHWSPENLPKCWCDETGDLVSCMLNDDAYVPLHTIREWDCKEKAPSPVQLYHGLKSVEVDLDSVLHSLAELQSPKGLYGIPLLVAYPRIVTTNTAASKTKKKTFQLQIGVYAHRLLPEVLSERDLLVVMSALDQDSYRVTEDLHMPPIPAKPTFESAKYPKLVFDVHDDDDEQEDVALMGSTRTTDDTLSAFSTPGLLKLWENTGTDVSEWPTLQQKLQGKLTMDLLLHQQHALCWMSQMESLGGFGVNSILWQEREWVDGGKYYYSPALGQLRLEAPHKIHGGLVCDEMGLGKTIMILALITVTLDELKKDTTRSHSTLIIVPPVLVRQWQQEIQKAAPQLTVQVYHARTATFDPPDFEELPADIVLTTYQALQNTKTARPLQQRSWGRIVLDEMQEIRSSTTAIAISCDKLDGSRRWMLSGTPLFDGIADLRGELNFLSLLPFGAKNEDGFFDFSITNHWIHHSKHGLDTLQVLGLLLLRRSKSMKVIETGHDLMGLKPLTLEFVPVSQTPYERALYCFLEHTVATQLKDCTTSEASQRLCLRLLRELCISPMLLSGGLGVSSAMNDLNNLLVISNRQEYERAQRKRKKHPGRAISCADAIRYLSQAQSRVQTASDFVSDLHLGVGGGIAKRNRATESLTDRLEECKIALTKAKKDAKQAQATRAKAYWHLALEKITTGQLAPSNKIKGSIAALWRWRAVVHHVGLDTNTDRLPSFLVRGWRPSGAFVERDLSEAHPDFAWAHPVPLALTNIPRGVQPSEIYKAIAKVLGSKQHKVVVTSDRKRGNWRAIVQLQDADCAKRLAQAAKKGIPVTTKARIPFLQEEVNKAKTLHEEIQNENDVYPTNETRRRLKEAEQQVKRAERGLLIVFDDTESPHIQLSRAKGPPRSIAPTTSQLFYSNVRQCIGEAGKSLSASGAIVAEKSKLLRNLERVSDIPEEVKKMSSFESLEAISAKEYQKTFCVICMGVLGSSDPKCTDEMAPGKIGLTPCGHLFCEKCISDYIQQTTAAASYRQPQCPTCRKDIGHNNLVVVDPLLSADLHKKEAKERTKAKTLIKKAAKALEKSNGQLDPDLWLQLYLSIDVPEHVSRRGDFRLSAIPREVVAFFRAATGFSEVHNRSNALPDIEPQHGLSSKAHALVRDLPKDERSVVFTSSRTAVKHLMSLFEYHGIGFRALFSGQHPSEAEMAVQEWKESSFPPADEIAEDAEQAPSITRKPQVLIVQSGAAASGLTLTAACKMFFIEPFVRQEEEQQAYARCHRFGQENEVHVKVYYTPVSVESRLLEWRKLNSSTAPSDTNVVFTDMWDMDTEEDIESEEDERVSDSDAEDSDQTLFLLGLQ